MSVVSANDAGGGDRLAVALHARRLRVASHAMHKVCPLSGFNLVKTRIGGPIRSEACKGRATCTPVSPPAVYSFLDSLTVVYRHWDGFTGTGSADDIFFRCIVHHTTCWTLRVSQQAFTFLKGGACFVSAKVWFKTKV